MSLTINMVGGGGMNYRQDALLIISGKANEAVHVTKGSTVLNSYGWWLEPYQAGARPSEIKRVFLYVVPASMFDNQNAFVVSVIGDSSQYTDNVIIDRCAVYEISADDTNYLISNGVVKTGLTLTNQRSASNLTTGSDENGNYVNLHSAASASSYDTAAFSTEIDVTNYNYLVFRGMARGYYSANSCPAFGLLNVINSGGSASTWTVSKMIRDNGGGSLPSSPSVLVLDISSYSGSYKIGFQEAGSGGNSWQGDVRCYDLYLTNENPTT